MSERPPHDDATDAQVLSWAKRRGWITFLFFVLLLGVFLVIWLVAR